jgi:methionyl aminopeptidase
MSHNQTGISIKSAAEIDKMRIGGRILAEVLEEVAGMVRPGITPSELSALSESIVGRRGAVAAFLGHEGFPAALCVSVNEVVVHGIPSKQPLKEGDIVGLDFGVIFGEMVTDGATEALVAGVAAARAGNRVGDISAAVERVLRRENLGVIEELVGHGVGYDLWEEPNVPNYGQAHTGPRLKAGMTIAIEPMATLGGRDIVIEDDGWTVRTADHSLAAQFEHTVLITPDGPPEILTKL